MLDLAAYASQENCSRGRRHSEPQPNNRSEYQRDRDRIVHSAAFRRLEYKTQVFVNHEGDMFRTRLTHSIEVAQIGRSVARILRLNEDLVEAIALAHDLGHTPFGHAGQDILNACMSNYGGFEHNLQSLRVVDKLEERYAEFEGLNLTFETREGILKHCSQTNARKLGDVGERFLHKQQPSMEAQLANVADEIAYNNHDIDDGLRAGLLTIEQMCEVSLFDEQYQQIKSAYPDISQRRTIHEVIRRMINRQVTDLISNSETLLNQHGISDASSVRQATVQMISYGEEMAQLNRELKTFLRHNLYQHYRVQRMTFKAKRIIQSLFDVFMEDSGLLPPQAMGKARESENKTGDHGKARVVADYIAGMTDRYAIAEYDRIYNPAQLT